jgi:mannose-6-phosphate isomerase-like protein (cupin superfamily)
MTEIKESNGATNEQRRAYWSQSRLFILHVAGEETDGRLSLVEGLLPPDAMTPLHVLPRVNQILYVLEGELTAYLPGVERVLTSGDCMLQPAGVPQTHRVTSAEPARVLAINSPAGFERFFIEAGRPAESLTLPPPEESPPDPEQLAVIAAKHGIDLLGPPGSLPDEAPIVIAASTEGSQAVSAAENKRIATRFDGETSARISSRSPTRS